MKIKELKRWQTSNRQLFLTGQIILSLVVIFTKNHLDTHQINGLKGNHHYNLPGG